jgi:hypothetical protein
MTIMFPQKQLTLAMLIRVKYHRNANLKRKARLILLSDSSRGRYRTTRLDFLCRPKLLHHCTPYVLDITNINKHIRFLSSDPCRSSLRLSVFCSAGEPLLGNLNTPRRKLHSRTVVFIIPCYRILNTTHSTTPLWPYRHVKPTK